MEIVFHTTGNVMVIPTAMMVATNMIVHNVSHSDPLYCTDRTFSPCHSASCGYYQFTCSSGECVDLYEVCDGENDCYDGSDEYDCSQCKHSETTLSGPA